MLCIVVLIKGRGINGSIILTHHLTCYTPPVLEMANVIIHGATFNSAQGDVHINNRDSGMYDFKLVQKNILIDDTMKDFVN